MTFYRKQSDGSYPHTMTSVQAEHESVTLGPDWPEVLGYDLVFPFPPPVTGPLQIAVEDAPELTGKRHWEQRWTVVDRFADIVENGEIVKTKAEQEAEERASLDELAKGPVPEKVTNYQARAVLMAYGLFDRIDTALRAEGGVAWQAWEYANDVTRGGPLVASMAAQLGLTPSQLDDLFREAAAIKA